MKYKSPAIALTYIKHGESSIICKILTLEKGLQTFIIKGVRSKKSKIKLSFFEPLKLLNIDANFNPKKSLQYLVDISIANKFNSTRKSIYNRFVSTFIAEINSKILQENEKNDALFSYIWESAVKLNSTKKKDLNFALKYMINLCKPLGFFPSISEIKNPFFELEKGVFIQNITVSKTCLDKKKSDYLKALLKNEKIIIPQKEKSELLKNLLHYYKLHYYNLDSVKSHLILENLR